MEVSVRTDYDYRQLLKLHYFHIKRKYALWCFVTLCGMLVLWLFASSLYSYGWNPEAYFDLGMFLVIVTAVPLMLYFSPRAGVRKSVRLGVSYLYTFSEDGFKIMSASDNFSEDTYIKYRSVYKVYETKHCFYIYISKIQAYIVDKNAFEKGTCDDLRALLRAGVRASALKIFN